MPRLYRWSLLVIVLSLVAWGHHPRAQVASSVIVGTGGTTFYGIGDLTGGGVNSVVQEATKVGSTVYVAGGSTQTATTPNPPNLDTAVVWDSVSQTLTVVPDLVTFSFAPTTTNSAAYAITPDGQWVASRLRSSSENVNLSNGVRVQRDSVTTTQTIGAFTALDISDNGNILFGQRSGGTATVNNSRAARFDISGATNTNVPLLTPAAITPGGPCSSSAPTCLDNLPAYRGMSADGNVLVGTAFTGGFTGSQNQYQVGLGLGFRWAYPSATVSEIPRPSGGTWSLAIAVTPNGNLTLAAGNSTEFPNGEVWLHNATTNSIQTFGSPNTVFSPRLYGGMTADGTVVGVTFTGNGISGQTGTFSPNPIHYAYLRNAFGWFHLGNVLAAQGVDLWANGWDTTHMILMGIRTVDTDGNGVADTDLVFGQGRRRTAAGAGAAPEGFVVSFPIGVLANYKKPSAAAVANRSLVGAWALGANPNNPLQVMVFLADGTYYTTTPRGASGYADARPKFEAGVYTLSSGNAFTLTTKEDRDGAGPSSTPPPFTFTGLVSSLNGRMGLSVNFTSADTFVMEDAACSPVCNVFQGTRIDGGLSSIVGAWTIVNPPFFPNGRFIVVFLGVNTGFDYFQIADGDPETNNDGEDGTYNWNALDEEVTFTPSGGGSPETVPLTLTPDGLGIQADEDGVPFMLTRIVDASTVLPAITNQNLTASGAEDSTFSYAVTAINALTFGATGLPLGLEINANTGVISGTPVVSGTFNVDITVTNALGSTTTATLVLTVAPPPARIYDIGDLPTGGSASAARDATRVNGVIYAVGAATAVSVPNPPTLPVPNLDTPVLWSSSGGVNGTLEALPYLAAFTSTQTDQQTAYAITPNGAYIASQARSSDAPGSNWVRVARGQLPSTTANLNLSLAANLGIGGFAALALSNDGAVAYGMRSTGGVQFPARWQESLGSNNIPLPAGTTWAFPIPRGTSSDGLVMVGAASAGDFALVNTPGGPFGYPVMGTNSKAFRYVHNANTLTGTTTEIPFLASGGTWNFPIAMTGDGALTVVAGNSSTFPNGELYLTDANNLIIDRLGSPNTGMRPRPLGGRTADGAIVATFTSIEGLRGAGQISGAAITIGARGPYVRNANGWFLLGSVLRAHGVDLELQGWGLTDMSVTSVRTIENVDLVVGQGSRGTFDPATGTFLNAAQRGFVIELPAGALANFNETVTAPADTAIVGAWAYAPAAAPNTFPSNPGFLPVFLPDGRFVMFTRGTNPYQNGFERGSYSSAGIGAEFYITTRHDTNGSTGAQFFSVQMGRALNLTGDIHRIENTRCNAGATSLPCTGGTAHRLPTSPTSVVGAWRGTVPGGPPFGNTVVTALFLDASQGLRYFIDYDIPGDEDEFELGTYTYSGDILTLTRDSGPGPDPGVATLSRDGLVLSATDDGVTIPLTRVVPPSSVVPTFTGSLDPLSATTGAPFAFTVDSMYALTVTADGLPPGLEIDPDTGEISGTPTEAGTFEVDLTATNTFGTNTTATLTIAVRSVQTTALSVEAQGSAVFGSSFTAGTSGGSGGGAVTFLAEGACSNVAGGDLISMTSGTGACVLTATKAGDDTYHPASSPPFSVTAVKTAQAALTITGAPGSAMFNESFSLGTSGGSTGGAVSFAATGVCSNVSGGASITMTGGTGVCSVTATMAGDANYEPVTSAATLVTAAKAAQSALAVTGAPSSASFDQSFSVGSEGGSTGGAVSFATTGVCSNVSGGSSITMTSGTGVCGVTATMAGDGNYDPVTSPGVAVSAVRIAQTVLTVTGAPADAVYGQSFSVGHSGGTTGGAVTFATGGACSNVAGGPSITMTSGTGTCTVAATMAGDSNYEPATSSSASVNAVKALQSALSVTGTPASAIYGQNFVAGAAGGTTAGAVTFAASGSCSNASGGATITMSSGVGTCSVSATMAGNLDYELVSSAPAAIAAAQATSTSALVGSPLTSAPGAPVMFTATVASQFGAPATGTVSFRRGGTTIGTASLVSNVGTLTLTDLGVGTHAVIAIYGGDASVLGSTSSSASVNVVAPAAATTTALASSLNPSIVGQPVTLTATVTSGTPGTPTGSITFKQGPAVIATVPMSGAQATYSPSTLPQGSSGFTAVYSGDAQYITSTSPTLTQQVNMATTSTALTSTPNPSNGGQLVTFTATVTSVHPGTPTGTVTFRRGSTVLAAVPMSGNQAVYATSALPTGSSGITAIYSGDTVYVTSTSATLTQQVIQGTTTSVLTISPTPSAVGQVVTFTAVVTSSTGVVPTGTVAFKEGGTTLGTGILDAAGVATFTTSTLTKGKHNGIKAQYGGDAYNGNSTSATASHTVQ